MKLSFLAYVCERQTCDRHMKLKVMIEYLEANMVYTWYSAIIIGFVSLILFRHVVLFEPVIRLLNFALWNGTAWFWFYESRSVRSHMCRRKISWLCKSNLIFGLNTFVICHTLTDIWNLGRLLFLFIGLRSFGPLKCSCDDDYFCKSRFISAFCTFRICHTLTFNWTLGQSHLCSFCISCNVDAHMLQRESFTSCNSHFSCVSCFRDLSCIHWHLDSVNASLVFVAFYVIELVHEFGWIQGTEFPNEYLLLGLTMTLLWMTSYLIFFSFATLHYMFI